MKNNKTIPALDAYKVITGRSFLRNVLSTFLVGMGIDAVITVLWTLVNMIPLVLYEEVRAEWDIPAYISVCIQSAQMIAVVFIWFMLFMKKLSYSDISDRNAAGSRYFCTLREARPIFAKGYVLIDAGILLTYVLFFLADTLLRLINYLLIISLYSKDLAPFLMEERLSSFVVGAAMIAVPHAAANLSSLFNVRSYRIWFTAVFSVLISVLCFTFTSHMTFNNHNDIGIWSITALIGIVMLMISQYLVIKKRNMGMPDDISVKANA